MFNGQHLVDWHTRGHALAQPTALFTGPVDTERFRPADETQRAEMRRELGVPRDAPFVGTIANLNPMKGIEWFIRAARIVYERRPDAWFLISGAEYAGHAGYRTALDLEMRATGVPLERFVVRHDPPDRHYPALDVKLITSLPASEGRTTTGPEAMACAIPVVATDVGAVREVIEDGETGFVVAPQDAEALARVTLVLLDDARLRSRFGATGRVRALERYALEPSARTMIDTFAQARGFHAARRRHS
jgi:glycosyltransferase involved in cell wall biosynthesis